MPSWPYGTLRPNSAGREAAHGGPAKFTGEDREHFTEQLARLLRDSQAV